MDIKLRARLSAYSKIESISGLNSNIPDADATNAGNILGVGTNGQYTLFGKVTHEDIDEALGTVNKDVVVDKDQIDDLFSPEQHDAVTKDEIDSLFVSTDKPDSATKEEIDTLFTPAQEEKIGTVSYAEIDSLFK